MIQKIKQRMIITWLIVQLMVLAMVWCLPQTVHAADHNRPDVQFTTGKYGQNCLTGGNWNESGKYTLNLTQNVYLDAAAQQRANQGELILNFNSFASITILLIESVEYVKEIIPM